MGQPQAKNTWAPELERQEGHGGFRGRQPAADALIVDFQPELSLFPQGRGSHRHSTPAPSFKVLINPTSPFVPAALEAVAVSTAVPTSAVSQVAFLPIQSPNN